jgi:hypothetical protein
MDKTRINVFHPLSCFYYIDDRLPFGKELDTLLAILTRCKIEQMMCQKRNEGMSIEKEMYFVEIADFESLVPDAKVEIERMFALWDAVLILIA